MTPEDRNAIRVCIARMRLAGMPVIFIKAVCANNDWHVQSIEFVTSMCETNPKHRSQALMFSEQGSYDHHADVELP